MKSLKLLLISSITLLSLTGCCWTDHSETIKEVAEPMAKELESFYKEHKRFPTSKERDAMLLASGCRKVKNEKCIYNGNIIDIERSRKTLNKEYDVLLTIDNTYCFFGLDKTGNKLNIGCMQQPCIKLGQ